MKVSFSLILSNTSIFSRFSKPFHWYFTSQNGEICIKESEKINVSEIQSEFTENQTFNCPIVATLILHGISNSESNNPSPFYIENISTSLHFEHFNESNLSINKQNIFYIKEKNQ